MELMNQLTYAAGELFTLGVFWAIFLGVLCGLIAGALPGIGGAAALAILFPLTYAMTVNQGMLFMLGVYTGAEYGGAIPAILICVPGTGAAVATTLDGYPLAQKGYPRKALTIALAASVFGSFLGAFIFALCSPLLTTVGLKFGPVEMFAVGVFGVSVISSVVGKSVAKGFFAAAIGIFLSTVGPSDFAGYRFTYGLMTLADGFPLVIMFMGFFALVEALKTIVQSCGTETAKEAGAVRQKDDFLKVREFFGMYKSILRCSTIGVIIGILPGMGSGVASFLAYAEERRWSKQPDAFGTGVPEGIVASEAANNSMVAGSIVPALTLGVPGSPAAALIMGFLIMKGVTPGPMLFQDSPWLLFFLFIGLMIITGVLFIMGYAGLKPFSLIANIPLTIIGPATCLLIFTGVYSYQGQISDLSLVLLIGVVAYLFERLRIPTVPLVLAFIMGPIMEYYFNQAILIYRGDMGAFFSSPIFVVIILLSLLSAGFGLFRELRAGKKSVTESPDNS